MITLDLLFRSIINFKDSSGKETISQKNLIKNFITLQKNVPDAPEEKGYKKLYFFINDYIRNCDAAEDKEVPSYEIIKKYFEEGIVGEDKTEDVLKILEQIRVQQPFIGQEYFRNLTQYIEEINVDKINEILTKASRIAQVGDKENNSKKSKTLKGPVAALDYIARHSKEIKILNTGVKLESQIISLEDVEEAKTDYVTTRDNPLNSAGVTTGLKVIDNMWKNGLQSGHMMLVSAFTSQGKTAFSMYMAYRAIWSGFNISVITMEQSFKEIRDQIYVKHTCNPVMGKKYPQFAHLVGKIDLTKVSYGELTKEEEAFYFTAMDDLKNTEGYGKLHIWYPPRAKPTISEIDFKLLQVQQEYKTAGKDLDLVVIDYITLLGLPPDERTRNSVEDQNNLIRQLKSLCGTFNGGRGIRMISPFQMNRHGYEEAKKNDGVYQLTALSDYHEAERSADIAIALFMDETLRQTGTVKVSCLKVRRNDFFKPFNAQMNKPSLFYTDSNISDEIEPTLALDMVDRSLHNESIII
jgi:replicative DNA helicase